MFSVWWLFSSNSPTTINCACFTWLTMQSVAKGEVCRLLLTKVKSWDKLSAQRTWLDNQANSQSNHWPPNKNTQTQNYKLRVKYTLQPAHVYLTNFRKMLEKSIYQQIICLLRRPGEERCILQQVNIHSWHLPFHALPSPLFILQAYHYVFSKKWLVGH